MGKEDLKKTYPDFYASPAGTFVQLDLPTLSYFMIDGSGDPNTAAEYRHSVEALYAASYTLKFMSKAELGRDYVVPPLEGLWWADDFDDFIRRRKDRWQWTLLILVPAFVPRVMPRRALEAAFHKKGWPALSRVRFDSLHEGRVVQTLHIGAYDDEGPVLHELHSRYLPEHALAPRGHHHEIYLSDPRKTAAARLRTLLRQPVIETSRSPA